MSVGLILVANGRSERARVDKMWADIAGRPLMLHTLGGIAAAGRFDAVVVVAPAPRHEATSELADALQISRLRCVVGGGTRRESVAAGLAGVGDPELVVVHDAARPLAGPGLFAAVIAAARQHGAATVAVPCTDTIKRVEGGMVLETLPRRSLVEVQTPQAFATDLLRRAHAQNAEVEVADDCELVERLGIPVAVVPGDVRNRKITYPEDIDWFSRQLERRS